MEVKCDKSECLDTTTLDIACEPLEVEYNSRKCYARLLEYLFDENNEAGTKIRLFCKGYGYINTFKSLYSDNPWLRSELDYFIRAFGPWSLINFIDDHSLGESPSGSSTPDEEKRFHKKLSALYTSLKNTRQRNGTSTT